MEDSIVLLVVNGFLMVDLGIPRIRRKRITKISEWKTHWFTQSFVQCNRNRFSKDDTISTSDTTVDT